MYIEWNIGGCRGRDRMVVDLQLPMQSMLTTTNTSCVHIICYTGNYLETISRGFLVFRFWWETIVPIYKLFNSAELHNFHVVYEYIIHKYLVDIYANKLLFCYIVTHICYAQAVEDYVRGCTWHLKKKHFIRLRLFTCFKI